MPFNNGLRPEGQIATGALITYVLIERAIISGRMTPAALAIIAAAFTLGIQPTGLIAVAALLAGGRPLLRILVRRHRLVGTWPLVAPLLAAGTVVLTVVFADQTLATVLEATRIRTEIGPSQAWYTENLRYYYLIPADGGWLAVATLRLPDHRAEPVRLHVHHAAAQAGSRCRPRPGVAPDGHHLRHDVLPDVHPDQMGAPLRAVRRRRCGDGRAGHRAGVTEGVALVAQPDDGRDRGAVPDGAVLLDQPTAGGTSRASAFRSTTRCRRSAESPSAQSSSRCSRWPRLYTLWLHFATARPRRGPVRARVDRCAHSRRRGLHGAGVRRIDGRRRGAAVPDLLQRVGEPAHVLRRLRTGRRRARRTGHRTRAS